MNRASSFPPYVTPDKDTLAEKIRRIHDKLDDDEGYYNEWESTDDDDNDIYNDD